MKAKVIDKTITKTIAKETYYLLVVDASSSMGSLTDTTISGVNEQIDMLTSLEKQFPDQKYFMSLVTFSNGVTIEFVNRKASELEHISRANYQANGMTALLDAIGVGINKLKDSIHEKLESGEAEAIVTIITDGEENHSVEFKQAQIKSMIQELVATKKWTVNFIGANIDTVTTASNYGINTSNTMSFSGSGYSNTAMYSSMSRSFSDRGQKLSKGVAVSASDFLKDHDVTDNALNSNAATGTATSNAGNVTSSK